MSQNLVLEGGREGTVGDAAKFGILTVSDRASAGTYEDLSGPAILQFFHEAVASPWTTDYRVIPDEQPQIEQAIIDMVGVLIVTPACSNHVPQARQVQVHYTTTMRMILVRTSQGLAAAAHGAVDRTPQPRRRMWQVQACVRRGLAPEPNACARPGRYFYSCGVCYAQVDNKGCCLVVTTGGTGPAPRDVTPEATEAVCDRMMPGYGEQMRAISLRYVPTAVLSRQTAGIRRAALVINLPGKPKSIRETFDEVFQSIPYCIQLAGGPYIETNGQVVKAFRPPADTRKA